MKNKGLESLVKEESLFRKIYKNIILNGVVLYGVGALVAFGLYVTNDTHGNNNPRKEKDKNDKTSTETYDIDMPSRLERLSNKESDIYLIKAKKIYKSKVKSYREIVEEEAKKFVKIDDEIREYVDEIVSEYAKGIKKECIEEALEGV